MKRAHGRMAGGRPFYVSDPVTKYYVIGLLPRYWTYELPPSYATLSTVSSYGNGNENEYEVDFRFSAVPWSVLDVLPGVPPIGKEVHTPPLCSASPARTTTREGNRFNLISVPGTDAYAIFFFTG